MFKNIDGRTASNLINHFTCIMFNQTPFYASYIKPPKIRKSSGQIAREEAREEEANLRRRFMAMRGHPCTGKTTLAWSLAQRHEYCSLVSLDDIRYSLVKVTQDCFPDSDSSPSKLQVSECLDKLAIETVCRIASRELQMGFHVVIDCSLPRRYHLDWMLQLSSSTGAKLIVIECQPQENMYKRQNWLEQQRIEVEDLQILLENYEDYDDRDVPKLVVDTTGHVVPFNVHAAVIGLYSSERVQHLDLQEWVTGGFKTFHREETAEDRELRENSKKRDMHFAGHVHQLQAYCTDDEADDDKEIICNGCLRPISGPAYNCNLCTFFLHKSCAESPYKVNLLPHYQHLPFLNPTAKHYSFPTTFSCSSKYAFSHGCLACLFLTHVRCGILPSVLQHPCHEHLLLFTIRRRGQPSVKDFEYQCHACDKTGYHVSYSCFNCNINIHVNCSFLPLTTKHSYHLHPLSLCSSLQEDVNDDYYCDICETRRNPTSCLYYCKECKFEAHLDCATSSK